MNGQLALDMTAGPLYRPTDPDTSRDAAVLALETAETLRDRCLPALRAAGEHGLTDFETAEIVGRQQTSTGKRRLELERGGLVAPRLVIDPSIKSLEDIEKLMDPAVTTDEIMRMFRLEGYRPSPCHRFQGRGVTFEYVLLRLYQVDQLSIRQTAAACGVSAGTVRYYLKRYAIDRRSKSEALAGSKHPAYGKPRSEDTRRKISTTLRETNQDPLVKARRSAAMSGDKNPMAGRYHTAATLRQIQQTQQARWEMKKRNSSSSF